MSDYSKYTLLIVDDDDMLRETLVDMFEAYGFKVLNASSGNKAFAVVEKNHIDLVVSDIRMADGDGIILLEKIRAFNQRIPVVVLITGNSQYSKEECISKGAKDVISKPFDTKQLVNFVKTSLGLN